MSRLEMREIQPIYQYGKGLSYNFKSKQILYISYLYGCLNQSVDEIKPPYSILEEVEATGTDIDAIMSAVSRFGRGNRGEKSY